MVFGKMVLLQKHFMTKILQILPEIGSYVLLMRRVFARPQKLKIFWNQMMVEIEQLGLESFGIVAFISTFMGAVVAIQTAYNITSPLIPMSMVGLRFVSR